MGEFDIINKYFLKLAKTSESLNFEDDAALLNLPEAQHVITVDTLIEDRHFFSQNSAKSIACKMLNVNLSDIAAVGASPKFWTLAISISKKYVQEAWLSEFCEELDKIQERYKFYLIGGDTTFTDGPLTLSVNIIGELSKTQHHLRKNGAREGDYIFISNTVGDAYWGYELLLQEYKRHSTLSPQIFQELGEIEKYNLKRVYLYPQAQIKLGQILQKYANSCADISDGLLIDIERICKFSGVVATLDLSAIKFSPEVSIIVSNNKDNLIKSVSHGDDYQLVFTVPKHKVEELLIVCEENGIFIQKIGEIVSLGKQEDKNGELLIINFEGGEISVVKKGFEHIF